MKLVALDLDGTLLNRDGSIAEETIKEMRRLHTKGSYVAIATGRPYKTTLEILANNGLAAGDGFPQILICDEREAYFLDGNGYKSWLPWNDDARRIELSLLPISREAVDEIAETHGSEFLVNNSFMQGDRGFVEIFYWSREEAEEAFVHFVDKLQGQPVKPVRNNRLIAFRWQEVGKGLILSKVAEYLGLEPHEILAMGDSHNDLGMLTRFNAATTQNADDEIKDTVRQKNGVIAASTYSLGVAEVLAQL
ncbi:MAG: HAD family phosphatase [Firmicutes bacterium]|nr:HAD family phosphatase [Bacillota bacterium]